jgi:hypothetical protein
VALLHAGAQRPGVVRLDAADKVAHDCGVDSLIEKLKKEDRNKNVTERLLRLNAK